MLKKITGIFILASLFVTCLLPTTAKAEVKYAGQYELYDFDKDKYVVKDTYKIDTVEDFTTHVKQYVLNFDEIPCYYLMSPEIFAIIDEGDSIFKKTGNSYVDNLIQGFGYSMSKKEDGMLVAYIYPNYDTDKDKEEYISKRAKEIIKSLNLNGLTEYGKVKKIYQWLIDNNEYAYKNGSPDLDFYTAYEVFKYKKSVCNGYALALTRLLNEAGIKSAYISGISERGGSHAWNVIQVDGKWYNADATWDDSPSGFSYFLKGSDNWGHIKYDYDVDYDYNVSKKDYDTSLPTKLSLPVNVVIPDKINISVGDTYYLSNKITDNYTLVSSTVNNIKITKYNNIKGMAQGTSYVNVYYGNDVVGVIEVIVENNNGKPDKLGYSNPVALSETDLLFSDSTEYGADTFKNYMKKGDNPVTKPNPRTSENSTLPVPEPTPEPSPEPVQEPLTNEVTYTTERVPYPYYGDNDYEDEECEDDVYGDEDEYYYDESKTNSIRQNPDIISLGAIWMNVGEKQQFKSKCYTDINMSVLDDSDSVSVDGTVITAQREGTAFVDIYIKDTGKTLRLQCIVR